MKSELVKIIPEEDEVVFGEVEREDGSNCVESFKTDTSKEEFVLCCLLSNLDAMESIR